MTFDEILTQVVVLLQREKRLSSRAFKIRFGLDDEYIDGTAEAGSGVGDYWLRRGDDPRLPGIEGIALG
jgi:hypothetical protein